MTWGAEAAAAWDASYKEAISAPVSAKAVFLVEKLGARTVTAAVGLRDAQQVRRWATGETEPREIAVAERLSLLFRITSAIVRSYGNGEVAQAFLRSANPQLEDEAPLVVMATGNPADTQKSLLAATRAFLEG